MVSESLSRPGDLRNRNYSAKIGHAPTLILIMAAKQLSETKIQYRLSSHYAKRRSMSYIDSVIENCNKAKAAKPVDEFVFSDPKQLGSIERCIYVIEEIGGDIEKTFNEFRKYKESSARRTPKPNSPSLVMYVGSSTTGLKNRIRQHIGDGPSGTYALNLRHWFSGKYKITIEVYNEPIEVLQIIEDNLAQELSPAFGKRGGNNK